MATSGGPIGGIEATLKNGKIKVAWKIPNFRNLPVGNKHRSVRFYYGDITWHLGLHVKDPGSMNYSTCRYRAVLYKDSGPACVTTNFKMTWELPNGVSTGERRRLSYAFKSGKYRMFGNLPSDSLTKCLDRFPPSSVEENYVIIRCSFMKVEAEVLQPQLGGTPTSEADYRSLPDFNVTIRNGTAKILWKITDFRKLPPGQHHSDSFKYGNLTWHLTLEVSDPDSSDHRIARYRAALHNSPAASCTLLSLRLGWILPNRTINKGKEKLYCNLDIGEQKRYIAIPSKPLSDCLELYPPSDEDEDFVVIMFIFKKWQAQDLQWQLRDYEQSSIEQMMLDFAIFRSLMDLWKAPDAGTHQRTVTSDWKNEIFTPTET